MTYIDHGYTVKCDSCDWEMKFSHFDGDETINDATDYGEFSDDDEDIFTCEECLKKQKGATSDD